MISSEHAKEFSLENLEEEIAMLEKEFSNDYQEIGFCHNDLQYGNIMIDETTKSITIIVSFLSHSLWQITLWVEMKLVPIYISYYIHT